ncbi:MAG: hypothetical protein LHW59_07480 [Candidatus Cloacimonetes bacterium]|nr:hypothetical protein [Candidatus Cloacimonadota bacterium]
MDELNILDILDKRVEVTSLFLHAELGPLARYFDLDSTELLDEKIRVLGEVVDGKTFDEIEGFYDIFELLPKEGIWD